MLWKDFLCVLGSWLGGFIANPLLQTANTFFFYFIFPLFVLLLCNRISKKYSFEVALEGAGALGRALQLSGQMPRASLSL